MDVRSGSDVAYDYQIAEETLEDQLPRICLQPIVENAITHGLRNVRRKDKKLLIRSQHEGENLLILIQDNGTGMDAGEMNELLEKNDPKRVEFRCINWNIECECAAETAVWCAVRNTD